jgi:hypothetical protein
MKISSANLQMASAHAATQHRETKESLRTWVGQQRPDFPAVSQRPRPPEVVISDAGKSAQSADDIKKDLEEAVDRDPGLRLIRQMLEFMTGEKIRITEVSELSSAFEQTQTATASSSAAQQSSGFGIEYDYSESYTETEQTSFAASGTVKTADGMEISFNISLSMSRSYHEESSVSLRLGDAAKQVDPLVLNFGGTAAQLTNQRFSFDLNADGQTELINGLTGGSGFLVFDRNNDGKINNGREMFGPSSGNGFAELSALDDDKNGWIDENDSAYNQLQVWQGAEGKLQSLASAGVGAIALSHISTPFSIKNDANDLMAQVRSSGIFLQHDGEAGTIQHVDLTV